jgi:holo-[acyl-carrier protein] synthase
VSLLHPVQGAQAWAGQSVVSVGTDVASISEVRRAYRRFGDRYLARVYTPYEVRQCLSCRDPAPHLAARFAAKEAGLKALGVDGAQPTWRTMEVQQRCPDPYRLALTGSAIGLARSRGVRELLVSLAHLGDVDLASAVVLALA